MSSSLSLVFADSAALMLAAARLPLATTLPSWPTVCAASVASAADRSAEPRMALTRVWASSIAGLAAPTNALCALRRASYCLSWRAAISSRSRAAFARLWAASLMLFIVSLRPETTLLSPPSSMISLSFCCVCSCNSLSFLVRSFRASSLCAASRAGPWAARLALSADSCRLAARRGMSRPLSSVMRPPRFCSARPAPAAITRPMPAITAKAANRLPRTPHFGILKRGRKRPRKRPRPRRIAIENSPNVLASVCERSIGSTG
ncbi:hypothetical protein ACVME9_000871 [Bradyrhizobium liaoningense]